MSEHNRCADEGFQSVRIDCARCLWALASDLLKNIDAWLQALRRTRQPYREAWITEIARGDRERTRPSSCYTTTRGTIVATLTTGDATRGYSADGSTRT